MMPLLVDASLRSLAVALLVGALLAALRVRASGVRHAAWRIVLAAMLLMPVLPLAVPAIPVPLPSPAVDAAPQWRAGADSRILAGSVAERVDTPAPSLDRGRNTLALAGPPAAGAGWHRWTWLPLGLYLAGVGLFLARLAFGLRCARRLVARSQPIDDGSIAAGAFESSAVVVPVTAGTMSPRVVLPTSWSSWPEEKLRAVLAHERAHVVRRDPLAALVARLNCCFFWFNPLSWWLERTLGRTAEQACDEEAVRATGERDRYAQVLVEMADAVRTAGGRVAWHGLGVDGAGRLGWRIDRVLSGETSHQVSRLGRGALSIATVLVVVAVVACRETVSVAPLQEDPEVTRRLTEQRAKQELSRAAAAMPRDEVERLEAGLAQKPDDIEARRTLKIFYQQKGHEVFGWNDMIARRLPHALWWIDNYPEDAEAVWLISPEGDPNGYAAVKERWLQIAARPDVKAPLLSNAATFLARHDAAHAERLLLRASAVDPQATTMAVSPGGNASLYWSRRLGSFYGTVMVEPTSPKDGRPLTPLDADGFAADVRSRLRASNDAELLQTAGTWLLRASQWDQARGEAGRELLQRAVSIDPQATEARLRLDELAESLERRAVRAEIRAREAELAGGDLPRKVRDRIELTAEEQQHLAAHALQAVHSLPEAQRLVQFVELADGEYMLAEYYETTRKDRALADAAWDRSKKLAQAGLRMAGQMRDSVDQGFAIYRANVTLATHALREGDRERSVEFMRAAGAAPSSDRLARSRQFGLDTRLVNYLLRAGERESVAEFLERSAALRTADRDRLLRDAAAVRAGRMPLSYQYAFARPQ